jgi:hypothetical protein
MKNKITKALLAIAFASPLCITAQTSPTLEWAQQVGRPVTPCNNSSFASTVDAAGNVYTTGRFQDTTDFDPGSGIVTLTPASTYNCTYIKKTAPNGDLIWAKHLTGVGDVFGRAIAVDDTGNVHIVGSFTGNIDFDPGTAVSSRTSAGAEDYFRVSLNPSGNFISATSGGGLGQELGTAIATDHSGSMYISYDLGGSAARDVAIIKGTGGVLAWSYQISGGGSGYCYGGSNIGLDAAGNIYITGFFRGTINFNPAGSAYLNSSLSAPGPSMAPTNDIFILKLTPTGVFAWVKHITGITTLQGQSIVADPAGNTYSTGRFVGSSIDFDPGSGTAALTSTVTNGYILKLDADGNFRWVKQVTSGTFSHAKNVALDNRGNVYVSGEFTASYSLPWASVGPFSGGSANTDGYIIKMDSAGNHSWNGTLSSATSTSYLQLSSISVTGDGNIYATCSFKGTADLDPNSGVSSFTSGSDVDLGLIKLKQCFLNDATTLSGTTLSATMTGVSYQWINCAGNLPVSGATAQNFTPTFTGNYAVIVSSGTCADTSACTNVIITAGVDNYNNTTAISVYPNPARDAVAISNVAPNTDISIVDLTGKTVIKTTASAPSMLLNTAQLANGVYIMKTNDNNGHFTSSKLIITR